jgi:protein-S-isoprenylcysteine O-methyltransferase Ste14
MALRLCKLRQAAVDEFILGGHMNTKSEVPPTENHPNVAAGIVMRFLQITIGLVLQAVILFLAVGRLNWKWAWIFLGIYLVSISINSAFMLRTSPETIVERSRPGKMKDWDKVVSGLWSLAQLALLLVAGLDVRFGWTGELGDMGHIAGAVVFAVGLGLFGWAMITNAYFSTVVRIQTDRGQAVCRTGPYRFVRHPGYAGAILQSLGIPFLLGSSWALIPGITAVALMIIRTSFEDHMLQAELPGYQDFAQEVRYRLVPGIW